MANKAGSIKIDPEDIVGKVFGAYKVNKYVGHKRIKQYRRNRNLDTVLEHFYEIECTTCGNKKIAPRNKIKCIYPRRTMCKICNAKTQMTKIRRDELCYEKARDSWRRNKSPNKNNNSTGIKRYSICFIPERRSKKKYQHRVTITIEGKLYTLSRCYAESDDLIPEYVELANKLNEIISHGKENFYQWYEELASNNNCE